jgi:hypothetical protein
VAPGATEPAPNCPNGQCRGRKPREDYNYNYHTSIVKDPRYGHSIRLLLPEEATTGLAPRRQEKCGFPISLQIITCRGSRKCDKTPRATPTQRCRPTCVRGLDTTSSACDTATGFHHHLVLLVRLLLLDPRFVCRWPQCLPSPGGFAYISATLADAVTSSSGARTATSHACATTLPGLVSRKSCARGESSLR